MSCLTESKRLGLVWMSGCIKREAGGLLVNSQWFWSPFKFSLFWEFVLNISVHEKRGRWLRAVLVPFQPAAFQSLAAHRSDTRRYRDSGSTETSPFNSCSLLTAQFSNINLSLNNPAGTQRKCHEYLTNVAFITICPPLCRLAAWLWWRWSFSNFHSLPHSMDECSHKLQTQN